MSDTNDDDKKGTGAAEIVTGGLLGAGTLAGATHLMKDRVVNKLGEAANQHQADEILRASDVKRELAGTALPDTMEILDGGHEPGTAQLERLKQDALDKAKIGDKSFHDAKTAADTAHHDATKGLSPEAKTAADIAHEAEWELKKNAAIGDHLHNNGATEAEKKLGASMKAASELEQKAHNITNGKGTFSRLKATFSGMSGGTKAAVCLGAAAVALGGGYLVNCWRNSGQPEGKQSLSGEQAGNFKQLNQQMGQGMARA